MNHACTDGLRFSALASRLGLHALYMCVFIRQMWCRVLRMYHPCTDGSRFSALASRLGLPNLYMYIQCTCILHQGTSTLSL